MRLTGVLATDTVFSPQTARLLVDTGLAAAPGFFVAKRVQPEETQMEVTYTMTPDDVVAFNRHQFETSPSLQRSYRMGFAWGVLAAAAFYLILGAWSSPWNAVFPALFLIIYLIWYPLTIRRNLGRVGKRMKTEGANRKVWGQHTLTLSETDLTAESEYEYSRLRWAGVERVDVTETHIFIYDSTTSAHVIPKRCFASLEAAQAFYHAAKTYCDRARA